MFYLPPRWSRIAPSGQTAGQGETSTQMIVRENRTTAKGAAFVKVSGVSHRFQRQHSQKTLDGSIQQVTVQWRRLSAGMTMMSISMIAHKASILAPRVISVGVFGATVQRHMVVGKW